MVSVGEMADVDLADLIDLFAADPHTDAIMMYVEGVCDAARFPVGGAGRDARQAGGRDQGRTDARRRAGAMTHSGAMTGSYAVYTVAFRRAGIVMVETLTDLFDTANVLSRYPPCKGDRVAVVTNGGGAGVIASDALVTSVARLATLSGGTIETLQQVLPTDWSRRNPVDILGDARPDRLKAATAAVLADPHVDAAIVLHCPTALETGKAMAEAVLDATVGCSKPVLGCWLGPPMRPTRGRRSMLPGLPCSTRSTTLSAGFAYLHQATAGREAAPAATPATQHPDHDRETAQAIITGAQREGRTCLTATEARAILTAYGTPTVATRTARNVADVARACEGVAAPYVLKIDSPDLPHKSDVGGVVLNLPDAQAAVAAAQAMERQVTTHHPSARINGFDVQPMIHEADGIELLVGVADDPAFGPVLTVGAGGKAVQVLNDQALELPPLDDELARAMIARTRIAGLLAGYRDVPAADLEEWSACWRRYPSWSPICRTSWRWTSTRCWSVTTA